MARTIFELVGRIRTQGMSEVLASLGKVDKAVIKTAQKIDRLGKNVSKIGENMAKATVSLAVVGAVAFKATQAASDLVEEVSKTGEVFGESSEKIEEWAKTTDTALGQSRTQAMKAANTFAIFGKSAGLAGDELVDFSTSFVGLASDLASFNNAKPEEAIVAIGAALRGESEPIRRFGVLLDDATLRAKALELGIVSSIKKALKPQQRVLAASAVIMDQTALAQGDFARTSGQLANQTRIMQAQLSNLIADLGKSLLPIALQIVKVFRDGIIPRLQKAVDFFGKMSKETKRNALIFGALLVAMGPALIVIGKVISSVKLLTVAVGVLNASLLANPFVLAAVGVGVLAAAVSGLVIEYKNLQKEHQKYSIMTAEQAQIDAFTGSFEALIKKMGDYGDALKDEAAFSQLLGKDLAALMKRARELGFSVEGTLTEKLTRLSEISNSLQGDVFELGEGLVRATKKIEKAAKTTSTAIKMLSPEEIAAAKAAAKAKAKFEENWTKKLMAATLTRGQLLDYEEQLALEQAEKIGAGRQSIEEYYSRQRSDLVAAENQRIADLNVGAREKQKEEEQRAEDEKRQRMQDTYNMAVGAVDSLFGILQMSTDNRIALVDQQADRERTAIENSTMNEEERAAALDAIDASADKKKRALMRKQAKRDKASAIFSATINTFQAISKALTLGIPGIILAVVMGALGAVQIGMIAAQPLPALAEGGLVKKRDGGIQAIIGEGNQDELVLPMRSGVDQIVGGILAGMRNFAGAVLPPALPGVLATGGAAPGGSTGARITNLNIGTLIADDGGMRDLNRRLRVYGIQEDQRRGEG